MEMSGLHLLISRLLGVVILNPRLQLELLELWTEILIRAWSWLWFLRRVSRVALLLSFCCLLLLFSGLLLVVWRL